MPKLTPKQQRFVDEYQVDLNATQAAIRAGYSKRTAQEQGSRLLSNVMVSEAIAKAQGKRQRKTEITTERVLNELALIGFADMGTYIRFENGAPVLDFSALPDGATAVISEITQDVLQGRGDDPDTVKRTKFKLYDKRAALVDIGKHLGMFIDRLGGPDGGPIKVNAEVDVKDLARRIALILSTVDKR